MYFKMTVIVLGIWSPTYCNCTVLKLAENAMDMLKRMRAGTKAERLRQGKRKAKEEVNELFNYTSKQKAPEKGSVEAQICLPRLP